MKRLVLVCALAMTSCSTGDYVVAMKEQKTVMAHIVWHGAGGCTVTIPLTDGGWVDYKESPSGSSDICGLLKKGVELQTLSPEKFKRD